jgi:hypothetical protein
VRILTDDRLRSLLAWLVIALLAVPVGGALWLGVAHGESPCILCWVQRTSMVLMALTALFVVRYGPRPRYLGVLILLGAWGVFMSLRHSALHLARDVGQGFAGDILGVHTYAWAWFIHWVVLLVAGALLLMYRGALTGRFEERPGRVARFAMALLVVLAGANAIQAFISTGPPPYLGQADPVRLSLNPRHWVWDLGETGGAPSLRGSWTIPEPDPAHLAVDPDPATGPIPDLPSLPVIRNDRIAATLEGTITGLAASPDTSAAPGWQGRMLVVTDAFEVAVLDSAMSQVLHRVVIDPGFSIDVSTLAGAAFLGPDTLAVMSTNKSYVLLRPDADADADREWRHFLETDGTVTELRRSRFATVRARQMYALSLAYDDVAGELITVGVPSPRHRRLVVSRFDRTDRILSSEFLPRVAMAGGDGREPDLAEYVVAGAAAADGRLYALSAAHSTLLVIDLAARELVGTYAVSGVSEPVGLAVRGSELLVAQADGLIAVLERPLP